MPKIEVHEKLFNALLGAAYSNDELEEMLPVAKAELDWFDTEENLYKFELNDTNRPDLWSGAGLARQLACYRDKIIPQYDFFSTEEETIESEGRS